MGGELVDTQRWHTKRDTEAERRGCGGGGQHRDSTCCSGQTPRRCLGFDLGPMPGPVAVATGCGPGLTWVQNQVTCWVELASHK
jgi:hypothetical protein